MPDKPEYDDYRHVLLYAKHHYECNNTVDDLRIILAKRCAFNIEHMTNSHIWNNMVNCLEKYATPKELISMMYKQFNPSYDEELSLGMWSETCPFERSLRQGLCILSTVQVFDKDKAILNLGSADPDILPLRKKEEETA